MNIIGPYAGHQLLLHSVQPWVDAAAAACASLRSGMLSARASEDWNDFDDGPANTWPLGEILASRHDLQHSRIFNS
jgi:urease accessory protein